ncbi:hypothetical protein EAO74_05615 [Streptomyces sp. gb1(2016)]|uniref:Uncharacterized protein n=1 Tax=Streptomyces sp. gb1(2016) TaxID=1828321 RepID=A0A652LAV8_9ACTN|nr:hypothetical protein EAO74_05615 [Streptomyces sp. gb1(2016)]
MCTRLRPSLWRREQACVATVSGRPVGAFLRMVGRQDTDQAESQRLGQMHGSATGAGLLNLWVRQLNPAARTIELGAVPRTAGRMHCSPTVMDSS